ncbi:hypothetical protein [Canibacter zhoujuaniae]|uniref:hypothetical protein n=1 Tax=Canibacter zhoujuaniae TaxID=2708343 RepID=UPI00141E7D75|nr:hypothetical protein [Canibacter zhoujuaniae]
MRNAIPLPNIPIAQLQEAIERLPATLLSAHRMHGALEHCGLGYRPTCVKESAEIRARSLASFLPPHTVICGVTAAWVWGAIGKFRSPIEVNNFGGSCRIPAGVHNRTVIRHARITADEVVSLGGVRVTTTRRTVFDLLYFYEAANTAPLQLMLLGLMRLSQLTPDDILESLLTRQHPRKQHALRLAQQVFKQS